MSGELESKLNCDEDKIGFSKNKTITYNDIAAKLLHDRLLLTALELHTELLEGGNELRQLKDFFSNPGNFELQLQDISIRLSRSGSQVTLDSLDLTRYSEDGGGADERVAVLEFELRKAKETINALRNNLTVATESENSSPVKGNIKNTNVGNIKPHEQRALNFLINEYLLMHGYKLTSITFADENEHQDFDDWDDVGLNISKPPELLTLYREGLKQTGQNCHTAWTQTERDNRGDIIRDLENQITDLNEKLSKTEIENAQMEVDNIKFQEELKLMSSQLEGKGDKLLEKSYSCTRATTKDSTGSDSPERFEFIDKNMSVFKTRDSVVDDNISNNSFNTSDWMNLNTPIENSDNNSQSDEKLKTVNVDWSKSPFMREVYEKCYIEVPGKAENDTVEEILNQNVTADNFINIVSKCLLRIIPNIILNKREDVIPLLISTVHLHPNSSERDKLLQQLFNLKKKPSEAERTMILCGLIGIAKCSGESLIENEILPQCWLQLTHKYVERRLLVAEACITLIPFVSIPIRNSLCLSMLQQMLEDKEAVVRETVIKALSLVVSACRDEDKYLQCEQLAIDSLADSCNGVVNMSTQLLFPILGKIALDQGCLTTSLLRKLLNKLNHYIKDTDSSNKLNQSPDKILRVINVIENLVPFLMMSIAMHENILSNIEKDMTIELRADFKNVCSNLTNPEIFVDIDVNCGMILYEFNRYISENPNESWPQMDWVTDVMLPDLFNNLHHIDSTQTSLLQSFLNLFSHICIIFGMGFSKYKIRPLLQNQIQNLEPVISNFNQYCPSLNIIPVYFTVLSYTNEHDELASVFKKFLCTLPLCGPPLDCLEISVRRLCDAGLEEIVIDCLWTGVVHQRPLVRAATATLFASIVGICHEELLKSKVTAALVTLASDNDVLVRTATVPAIGNIITDSSVKELHDKAYMQLQTYLGDSNLKENHTLLRQLIVTLGNIVNSCSDNFRNDVIIPQLTSLAMFMSQMKNQTRKVDMAVALLEAFANVVFSPLKIHNSSLILSGLRFLEVIILENQTLSNHWDTLMSMIKECDNKTDMPQPLTPQLDNTNKLTQNVNQGVEEMRQRVSKIFNKPAVSKHSNLPNIPNIFKKK